jgi:protein phosphatase
MAFNFKIAAVTDTGKVRNINEDNFSIAEPLGLFMVADGLGGHNAGEVASKMAIEVIKNHMKNNESPLVREYKKEFSQDTNRILSGIRLANSAIYNAAQKNIEQQGMGTTVSSILINNNVMTLAHVGDSRIYRIRGGSLERLTRDHSMIEEQLELGLISKAEAEKSKQKNIITRALGVSETIQIDADEEIILDGDWILLCTDGLTDMVREEEILDILLNNTDDPQDACKELVDKANNNGGMDNITVILLYCEKQIKKSRVLERAFWAFIDKLKNTFSQSKGYLRRRKEMTPPSLDGAKGTNKGGN